MKLYKLLGFNFPGVEETAADIMAGQAASMHQPMLDEPVEEKPKNQHANVLASLTMNVLKNGDTSIYFTWEDNSDEIAQITAQFLHRLCTGKYKRSFEEILASMAVNTVRMEPFVRKIEQYWKEQRRNEPIIRPRDALRMNNNQ